MLKKLTIAAAAWAFALTLAPSNEALAQAPMADITINGDTTGQPRWHRPFTLLDLSGVGTDTPFEAFEITIVDPGQFRAFTDMQTHTDTFLHLYQGVFDPLDQFTNLIALDDDGGALQGLASEINATNDGPFDPGEHTIVVSGFRNTQFGTYLLEIFGAVLGWGPSDAEIAEDIELHASNLAFIGADARFNGLTGAVRHALKAREGQAAINGLTGYVEGQGALNTGSGWLADGVHVWGETVYRGLDDDNGVDASLWQGQIGVDIAVAPGWVMGVAAGGASLKSDTLGSSIEGASYWAQPYLGFDANNMRGVISATIGALDYDDYIAGGITGTAEGLTASGNLYIAYDQNYANGVTLTPYGSITFGEDVLNDFGGGLAGFDDLSISYFQSAGGLEISRSFDASAGMDSMTGRAFARVEGQFRESDAPEATFTVTNFDRKELTLGFAAGAEALIAQNIAARIEGSVDRVGADAVEYGRSGTGAGEVLEVWMLTTAAARVGLQTGYV